MLIRFETMRSSWRLYIAALCLTAIASAASAALKEEPRLPASGEPSATAAATRFVDRARSAWQAKDYTAVIDTLSQLIAMPELSRPMRAAAFLDRGNAHLRLGDTASALVDFDASLDLAHPEPERVYLLRGIAFETQGNRERAAWNYIRALRAAPTNEVINRHVMRFFSRE